MSPYADATEPSALDGAPVAYSRKGWDAKLSLRFAARGSRTALAERAHRGPLVVQKPLYPEGENICHAVVVHPPGGVAGGDRLELAVDLGERAHALLTTPGAGKWYKANGVGASQALNFAVADNAVLEWLPQETILFDAADVRLQARVELAQSARYAGWEILCFGRRASGERFASGHLRQRLQLWRAGKLIWNESADVKGGSPLMHSPVGLNGCAVSGTFVVAAGALPPELLEQCRALAPDAGAAFGVTALPEIFAARYLGNSAENARHYFEAVWTVLRPWYGGVPMARPRIWNT